MSLIKTVVAITSMVNAWTGVDLDRKEVFCLAKNIYHEARGESVKGQMAVAFVTLNRTPHLGSVCETVYQPYQFSWTQREPDIKDRGAWEVSAEIAAFAMAGMLVLNPIGDADHYYNPAKSSPVWADRMDEIATIGNHRFVKHP